MQCKDIPDAEFVAAVATAQKLTAIAWGRPAASVWSTRWDVGAVLSGRPDLVQKRELFDADGLLPERLVLAKARKLIRRGLLTGCDCGCRGDLEVVAVA